MKFLRNYQKSSTETVSCPFGKMLVQRLFLFLAKEMLAQRVKKLTNILVADCYKRKTIRDAVLITNECLDSERRQGEVAVMCKLDIEKAFDHVILDTNKFVERTGIWGQVDKVLYLNC